MEGHNLIDAAISRVLSPDAAAMYRDEQRRLEAREAVLCEQVRKSCIDALECIASSMRHPRISEANIAEAVGHLALAHKAAQELDK